MVTTTETKSPVQSMATLKMLRNAGFITFHRQTGTKITGLYSDKKFTCFYIDDHLKGSRFTHKGITYSVDYVSGCFCPYVYIIKG